MLNMMAVDQFQPAPRDARRAPPRLMLPDERRSPVGTILSIAFHAALLAMAIWQVSARSGETRPELGPGLGGEAGGGGGGGGVEVTYIDLPAAAPAAAPAAEETEASREEVVPVETSPPIAPAADIATATPPPASGAASSGAGTGTGAGENPGSGGGTGGGQGGGVGTGVGAGMGPGTGGDSLGITPPSWRFFAPPLGRPPKELRGQTLRVRFWVRADGTTERFETEPAIENDNYRRKFAEIAMATLWRPARRADGTAVAAVAEMQVTLPSDN